MAHKLLTLVGGAPVVPQERASTPAIERRGARLLFLPPYSPDFNPIEMAFAKIRALPCKAGARTCDALLEAVRNAIDAIAPTEAANYFTAAGYEPD